MIDWFYSDPHFGHSKIIRFAERPFRDVWAMNDALVCAYQDRVGSRDLVLWLGDCFFLSTEDSADILASLPGKKVLVVGNHDKSITAMARIGFDVVVHREIFLHVPDMPDGWRVRAAHYPYAKYRLPNGARDGDIRQFEDRPIAQKREVLIHGHTHVKSKRQGNMIHVGVDAWDYGPARAGDVFRMCEEIARPGGEQ